MEIQNSSLSMHSARKESRFFQRQESLSINTPANSPPQPVAPQMADSFFQARDSVTLSSDMQRASQANAAWAASDCKADAPLKDLNMRVLKIMVERVTGKKIKLMDLEAMYSSSETASLRARQEQLTMETAELGWGMVYRREETLVESQNTSFQAEGQIRTKDGMEIDFTVSLNMSREFIQHNELNIQAGEAVKDPLVVNFAGHAAELSQNSFSFDIDCDGQVDQLSSIKPGSGFLALDRNQDDHINDGSELFGPRTGQGFAELAAFDKDDNDWIDENDAIYDRLRIWTRDDKGESRLFGLGEKGIGAICLKHLHTPFDLKNQANELLGQIKSTGVFLEDSGRAGTIQELDFVV